MMKRFTLTMMGLLMLLGGVNAEDINLNANTNIGIGLEDNNTTILFQNNNPKNSRIGGPNWATSLSNGKKHVFTLIVTRSGLPDYVNNNNKVEEIHLVALNAEIGNGTYGYLTDANFNGNDFATGIIVKEASASFTDDDEHQLSIELNESYNAVYLYSPGTNDQRKIKVVSFTRTEEDDVPAVVEPTISPASGNYDGDFNVTITPGDGNTSVKYSISGSTSHDVTKAVITEETVISFTDNRNITVRATGYDGENASSEVSKTYTYGIPDGKETPTVNYYQIVPLTMSDGTTPAYYDFEDGTTLITGTSNINSDKLSIVDCDAAHTNATGSTKCMKIDLSDKTGDGSFYDVQVQLVFNNALTQNKQYKVHFWTKADASVNNETRVRFQKNGNGWTEYHRKDITYDTGWTEYSYDISANGTDCTLMFFDLGKVANNTIYLDDVTVYDVTSGNAPVAFTSRLGTAVVSASAFNDYATGDYVSLNITGTPTEIAYKEHASNDETAISNYPSYTALTQTNGNWLIRVTEGMKTNGLTIKGHDMTLNSADIYKKVVISELVSNAIASKYDNVVVELTRSFAANKWNTVCLPYKPTPAQATLLFGTGYQIAGFTGVSGTTLVFTNLESINNFVAGRPYLLMPGTGYATSTVVLENVNITAKNPETVTYTVEDKDYSFSGTFNTKSFAKDKWSTTRFVSNNLLMTPNSTDAMKGLRCYFTLPAADAARSFSLGFDEEDGTTSINTVQGSGFRVNGYYNLNGQRVAKPTKGLFIVNGKKVVIK